MESSAATTCYRAALTAAGELSDRLVALLRKGSAIEKVDVPIEESRNPDDEHWAKRRQADLQEQMAREPWPHGPRFGVDVALRDACLERDAMDGLIASDPVAASEILLALLIKPRRKRKSKDMAGHDIAVARLPQFHFPFYVHGPFLSFLQIAPEHGITMIIALADHATERWCELRKFPSCLLYTSPSPRDS